MVGGLVEDGEDYDEAMRREILEETDIVLGAGRAIVFVDPAETAVLDKAESCAYFLPLFLTSDLYRRLNEGIHP